MIGVFGSTNERVEEVLTALGCRTRLEGALYSVCRAADGQLLLAVSCEALRDAAVLETLPRARGALFAAAAAAADDSNEDAPADARTQLSALLHSPRAPVVVLGCGDSVADALSACRSRLARDASSAEQPPALVYERVVNAGGLQRRTTVLGRRAADGSAALVTLALSPLAEDALRALVEDPAARLAACTCAQRNGKYAQYVATLAGRVACTLDVVAPAGAGDIAKAQPPRLVVVAETPALYARVVAPMIARLPASETAWIANIIDPPPAAEAGDAATTAKVGEEVLFENEHAVLLRDTKWPAGSTDARELYCLLIVKRVHAHLRSVRDLRGGDADWLAATVRACEAHIRARFGVAPAQCRAFFHYPPSFYHLHIHFVHVDSPTNGPSTFAGRALLVRDVVQNLRVDPDYYRHATLTVCAADTAPAIRALIAAGAIDDATDAGAGDTTGDDVANPSSSSSSSSS